MSDRLLERARALLERAAHPSTPEEEARTSAVAAAKLIAKERFTLVRAELPPALENEPTVDDEPPFADFIRRAATAAEALDDLINGVSDEEPFREVSSSGWHGPEVRSVGGVYRVAPIRVNARCRSCGRVCLAGETVAWDDRSLLGAGVTHLGCRQFWSTPEASRAPEAPGPRNRRPSGR